MPPDGTETEYPESPLESESGGRPYGLKPYGLKPYGLKPYGLKPYGLKPYGLKPYGLKPYGLKPYGLKPYGLKPYGLKPYGLKSPEADLGAEWSADVSELVGERSAVIRLGATVVCADDDVHVPWLGDLAGGVMPFNEQALASTANTVTARVQVPNRRARDLFGDTDLGDTVKLDLAERLARSLDEVLLVWPADRRPDPEQDNDLGRLRDVLELVRDFPFRNPGWAIDRVTFDELTRAVTDDGLTSGVAGRTLDTYPLLRRDGADGGVLLGLPAVTSAGDRVCFSADWDELWVGIDRSLVNVSLSEDSAFDADETVIRATMRFGHVLRRPEAFGWTQRT
jgi:Phage capsid family